MYRLSMIVTLVGALALAGCSDGAKESKGEKGEPGPRDQRATRVPPAPRSGSWLPIIDGFVPDRRNHDQRLLHRHL